MSDASQPRTGLRFMAFCALAVLLALGPAVGYFAPGGDLAYVGWKMFSRTGLDVCVAKIWRGPAGPDGERQGERQLLPPVDGKAQGAAPPRFRKAADARRQARAECDVTGPGADLRVEIACAAPRGWDTVESGERNACAAPR